MQKCEKKLRDGPDSCSVARIVRLFGADENIGLPSKYVFEIYTRGIYRKDSSGALARRDRRVFEDVPDGVESPQCP